MAGRPTKYAHVVANLPKFNGVEPERRDLVDAVKAQILTVPAVDYPIGLIATNLDKMNDCFENLVPLLKSATNGKRYASTLAQAYALVREVKEKLKEWESNTQLILDAYEQLMTDQFEVEHVTSMRMEDGGGISTYQEPYAQVTDKEAHRLWSIQQGLEKDMTLPWSKTNALMKEMLLAGEPEPPGISVYAKTMVRLNKA